MPALAFKKVRRAPDVARCVWEASPPWDLIVFMNCSFAGGWLTRRDHRPSTRQFRAFDGHGGLHVEELSIAVGLLLRELSVVHINLIGCDRVRYTKCDQSRSVKNRIYWTMVSVGTWVSVGAAIVLREIPAPDTKV